ILNLPMVGVFVKLLKMPKEILFSAILVLVVIGAYAIAFSLFGLMMLDIFGVIGYLMDRGGIPLAPAILALVRVPLLEDNFRRMLQISGGSCAPLITRPVSLSIISLMVVGIVGPIVFRWWVSRRRLLADVTVSWWCGKERTCGTPLRRSGRGAESSTAGRWAARSRRDGA